MVIKNILVLNLKTKIFANFHFFNNIFEHNISLMTPASGFSGINVMKTKVIYIQGFKKPKSKERYGYESYDIFRA